MMATIDEVTILLVEDNPGHARLIEKNLRRAHIANPIIPLMDGQVALDYFFGDDGYVQSDRSSPLLVLLDLNLPVVDGYRVLEKIRSDTRTKSIPIIILTTTDDTQEIDRCYELGANVYITKPVEYEKFADAIGKLGLFLTIVMLPEGR